MATSLREVESKYDVDDHALLPDLADLPGVVTVDGPHTVGLEATYFDTADLALARHGITLRRRAGGADEGWHLKIPVDGAREEFHAPLGSSTRQPPIALRRIVQGIARGSTLVPVATLVTERTEVTLRGEDGALLAVLCDDRVAATRPTPAGPETHTWREWELEEHASRRKLVRAVQDRIDRAGAQPSEHGSKLGRVLGLGIGPPAETAVGPAPGRKATERALLGHQLRALAADVRRLDPLARADFPDAVHELRVAFRRIRATLTTFDKPFDATQVAPVVEDLEWIDDLLGHPRDLEVLRERFDRLLRAQPTHLLRGHPGRWLDAQLRTAHRAALREAIEAMGSARYFGLVDTLERWRGVPPWSEGRDRRAGGRPTRALDRACSRLEAAVAAASEGDDEVRPTLLHDVRKAAKRVRYAAETLAPVLGADAGRTAAAMKQVQKVLGEHHDLVVAGARLLDLSDTARASGRDTFTFGVLAVRLEAGLAEHEREFAQVWEQARRTV